MKRLTLLGLILCTSTAFAGSLTVTESEAVGKEEIPTAALLNGIPLKRVGTGVRQKKILFIGVDVYRATLFASEPSFSRDPKGSAALDSLQSMKARAIQLRMLRSLSSEDILKSFEAALQENGVKDSPSLFEFKKAIKNGGDIASGDLVTLSVDNEKNLLICEQGKSKTEIKGDAKLFRDVFSIWLGKPADSGLANLRETLIKGG